AVGVGARIIGNDAEVDDLAAERRDRRTNGVAVRRHDALAALHSVELIDVDQLVARREHGDARPPVNRHRRAPNRGEYAELLGAEHRPSLERDLAGAQILGARPHVSAGVARIEYRDALFAAVGVLDANHG